MPDLAQELEKQLALLVHHMDTPVLSSRAAARVYAAAGVFEDTAQAAARAAAIHPSALARCARMAYMEFENYPRLNIERPPNVTRAANVGTVLHGLIQRAFARTAKTTGVYRFRAEVPLSADMPDAQRLCLAGNSDGVLEYLTWRLGIEIKGLGETEYASLENVREKDALQASVYQHCLKLDAVWFIYISRRSYAERHIIQRVPDQAWDAMRKRATLVLEHKLMDMCPPGSGDAYECEICAYEPGCPHPRTKSVPCVEVLKCLEHVQKTRAAAV